MKRLCRAWLYYSNLSQRIQNGNVAVAEPCAATPGFLCTGADAVATGRDGQPIADFLNGGPYSQLNLEAVDTNGYGASAQATHEGSLFGLHNHLVGGFSFDGGVTEFTASSATGGISAERAFIGPGVVIDQPDGSIAPVRLGVTNAYYGIYLADVLDLTSKLSVSLSGRMNAGADQLERSDRNGLERRS